MRLPGLVTADPYLTPFASDIRARIARYEAFLKSTALIGGVTGELSQGHHYFGFTENNTIYREWAPNAHGLFLTGDFNGWDRSSHPLERDERGVWEIRLPAGTLLPGQHTKVHVHSAVGPRDRIPAYIRRVVQDPHNHDFTGEITQALPASRKLPSSSPTNGNGGKALRIYEAHPGMATEEHKVGSWAEFTENVLPRIVSLGYNAVQLMGVQEHPYYGSFGYHVSSLFAPSSRFGVPEDLRALIVAAHEQGIAVIMDLVHSHVVKNWNEGLGYFDGTDHQYFHAGARGEHPAWDSLCWDYSKFEVQRLLLSNVRYWLEEFGFDGFRFDGVTSMLYIDHGLGRDFNGYPDYFGPNVDEDAVLYLQLANDLAHTVNPNAITVAEDMSGMPGMARPVKEGGLGFDYRLAMGVPDFWIRTLKEVPDERWSLGGLWHTLLNRRANEKHIGYAESHDQALVGDKTMAFQLMDAAMYSDMAVGHQNPVIDRGIALHKLIRLITFALSGEGYLNFMGNEFGHPEWIDFPREGNGWSYDHARRQWSLVDSPSLRYAGLNRFDTAMQHLPLDLTATAHQLAIHEDAKLLLFERGGLVFAFNWHPTESYADLSIPVPEQRDYQRILCTDDEAFAGPNRVSGEDRHIWSGNPPQIKLYLPSRCAIVFAPAS